MAANADTEPGFKQAAAIGANTLAAHITITIQLATDSKHHQMDYSSLAAEMAVFDQISFDAADFGLGSFCLDPMLVLFGNFDHSSISKNQKMRHTLITFE